MLLCIVPLTVSTEVTTFNIHSLLYATCFMHIISINPRNKFTKQALLLSAFAAEETKAYLADAIQKLKGKKLTHKPKCVSFSSTCKHLITTLLCPQYFIVLSFSKVNILIINLNVFTDHADL